MVAALFHAEDDKLFSDKKKSMLFEWVDATQRTWNPKPVVRGFEDDVDEYRRLLGVPRTTCVSAQAPTS